jgi:hypothetical protein
MLFEQLLTKLALCFPQLLVESGSATFECHRRIFQLAPEIAVGLKSILVLGPDLLRERFRFTASVRFQRLEAFLNVFLQFVGFPDQALLQPCETPVELTHLSAEEDVAHLVQAGTPRRFTSWNAPDVVGPGACRCR